MKRHNAIIVLEILFRGGRVTLGAHEWCMLENNEVAIVAQDITNNKEVMLGNDCTLNDFIALTEQMTDDEVLRCMPIPR